MQLIQILLPLADNDGAPFPDALLRAFQAELVARFGGLTAFSRAPAKGIWSHAGARQADDIVVLEVMAPDLDREWWHSFRRRAERELRQDVVVVRASAIELL